MANPILFLPGTGIPEEFYSPLVRCLGKHGDVVTWEYRHCETMVGACRRLGGNARIFESLRSEVCFGPSDAETSLLGLSQSDSICSWYENLNHLAAESNESLWKKTIVVGHSQGAGHALMISQKKMISGVLMISGPADSANGKLAPWTKKESRTPAEKKLLMVHAQDAGKESVLAHAQVSGLRQWELSNEPPNEIKGLALIDSQSVPVLTAHGCLAGGQTWGEDSDRKFLYREILDQAFKRWLSQEN